MSPRKFYKLEFKAELLSEVPIDGPFTFDDLGNLSNGDCSGSLKHVATKVINAKQCAKALQKQGSDPEFFMINSKGEDTE